MPLYYIHMKKFIILPRTSIMWWLPNSFIYNFMLSQNQTSKKFTIVLSTSKQNLATDRSLPSNDRYLGSLQIAPWSGDEYYSNIKQLIKSNNQRKRSQTSTALRSKISLGKQKNYVPKIKHMELQVLTSGMVNQWSRTVSKKSSQKLSTKNGAIVEKWLENQKSAKLCPAVTISKEANPIHFRKSSLRQFPQSKMKTQKKQEQQKTRIKRWQEDKYKLDKGKDKQSRMFFFQTKNSSNMSNRQKMVMKIRNIEKGRVERVYTQPY